MDTKKKFSYSIKKSGKDVIKELQYSDYSKNLDNEENLLLYKNVIKNNEIIESFNKLQKNEDQIKELIGNSKNKGQWKIKEYENSLLQKQYKHKYNRVRLNINYDMIENIENKNSIFIKDKME